MVAAKPLDMREQRERVPQNFAVYFHALWGCFNSIRGCGVIIGVAVKAGELMVALPKPNRHADCINIILSLGLVWYQIFKTNGVNHYTKVFIVSKESSIHAHKQLYTLSNVANKNGQKMI